MSGHIQAWLFGLQTFHVLFLLFHDWIPVGRLNNVAALRAAFPRRQILLGTVISSVAPQIGWVASIACFDEPYPRWLGLYLLAAYGFLFIGEIEAWWAPYWFGYKPERAPLYQKLHDNTLGFLPLRHGIAPNGLHVVLHAATVATLILLVAARL